MTEIVDRFAEVIEAINQIDDRSGKLVATSIANIMSPQMQRLIEKEAPSGEKWAGNGEQRPSVRLGYGPISAGWNEPEVEDISQGDDVGVKILFSSRTPQAGFTLYGVPAHPEPTQAPGPMKFWWFRENHFAVMFNVNHPGQPINPYTQRAWEPEGREATKQAVLQEAPKLFTPLRDLFGG